MVSVFTLTPTAASQALKSEGLDALGLTAPLLAPAWGTADPTVDAAALTMAFAGTPLAPWRGVSENLDDISAFRATDGAPLVGKGAALRLHPAAAARLERIARGRYAAPGQPLVLAVPQVLLVRGFDGALTPRSHDAGEQLPAGTAGLQLSFHDGRGLIVDPVAVAAMFDDLMTAFPALDGSDGTGQRANAGGVRAIGAIKSDGIDGGVLAQVVTLHGRAFAPPIAGFPGVTMIPPGGGATVALRTGGLATLAAGSGATATLVGDGTGAAARIRLGWAGGGTMGPGPLAVPPLPAGITLARRFVRAFAVDLEWHLRGNRSAAAIGTVPAADQAMPPDLRPVVRDGVTIDYLADGPDMLAAAGQVAARLTGATGERKFAVSPRFDVIGVPAVPGPAAHWPLFPPGGGNAGFAAAKADPEPVTAEWTGANDIVVGLPADFAPPGASVRIFPKLFRLIDGIGAEQSFTRGDGGTALAAAGAPVAILLRNPFAIVGTDPRPDPAILVFDLIVTARDGRRRTWAARSLTVLPGTPTVPADPFAAADPLAAFTADLRAVSPAPLFGVPRTTAPATGGTSAAAMALALGSETQPRQGPRLPTMMRHGTIVLTGLPNATNLSAGLSWQGVVSGGRWLRESLSADYADANPGNPAGPDTHAPGIRITGALAYDLALHAVRRAQPIFPRPGGAGPGWFDLTKGDDFNPPVVKATTTPGTSAGILLETIAAVAETPELSLLPDGNPLDSQTPLNVNQAIAAVAAAIGAPAPPTVPTGNADRLANALRREYFMARSGSRDAFWSMARAIADADEFVYIESASFARTARPVGTPAPQEIDLVEMLYDRMQANRRLKVIVCIPRDTDFAPPFRNFVRRAILQRKEAADRLAAADAGRVVLFHPRGFPGRWAQLRTTSVIVDDVWCLTGATHMRRRGMTFDGSVSIASLDHTIAAGYSRKVALFRQALMAAKLGVAPVDGAGLPTPEWLRLQHGESAFRLITDLLRQGGGGRLAPLWLGPSDATLIPAGDDETDPDGTSGAAIEVAIAGLFNEMPVVP